MQPFYKNSEELQSFKRRHAPRLPLIETGALLEAKKIMRARFPLMLARYVQAAALYIDKIEAGISARDTQLIFENTHPLKSSSETLGLLYIGNLAGQMEDRVRGEVAADFKILESQLEDLKRNFSLARARLEKVIQGEADPSFA